MFPSVVVCPVGPEKSRGLSPHASDEDLVTTLLLRFSDLSFFKKFTDHFFRPR